MATNGAFEDIRPYRDPEVPEVIHRVVKDEAFRNLMKFVYPDRDTDEVLREVAKSKTIRDFQIGVAYPAMRKIINQTIDELTVSGLENLKKEKSYLFISNHRDIILDSAIMNILLHEAGLETFETAIGSNLLEEEIVRDLTKLNKNFTVKRNTGAREFYENSMRLSAYIHKNITEGASSVWIAQREGRTKNGIDKTQPGLLKMLSINCKKSLSECFEELNLTPVAISYEYDPCDVLKIPELKALAKEEKYEKKPGEDYQSILTGITGHKGRVHLNIGETLSDELSILKSISAPNDKLKKLGELIDEKILAQYRLWPTNYIALDILEGNSGKSPHYTKKDRQKFEKRMERSLSESNLVDEEAKYLLLQMYANPAKGRVASEVTSSNRGQKNISGSIRTKTN